MRLALIWDRMAPVVCIAGVMLAVGCGGGEESVSPAETEPPETGTAQVKPAAPPRGTQTQEVALAQQASPAEDEQQVRLNELYSKADELYQGGKTNELVDFLMKAFDEEKNAEVRQRAFVLGQQALLMAGRPEDAKQRFLKLLPVESETAEAGLGLILDYSQRTGDTNGLYEWSMELVDLPLSSNALRNAYSWHLGACAQRGDTDRLVSLVKPLESAFGTTEALSFYPRVVSQLIGMKRVEDAGAVVDGLTTVYPEGSSGADSVALLRVDLLLARAQWDEVATAFKSVVTRMEPTRLRGLFSKIAGTAMRKSNTAFVDSICEYVLAEHADIPVLHGEAVRLYLQAPLRLDAVADLPGRFLKLLNQYKIAADSLAVHFGRSFYKVLGAEDKTALSEMLGAGEKLYADMVAEDARTAMRERLVDGYFSTDDFAKALKWLEQGMPGSDPDWVKLATTKVRAHLALQNRQYAEAVSQFQAFMSHITDDSMLGADPSTGIRHTVEMCYGLNHKRIGDIWTEAGEPEKAKAAYRKAVAYYQEALDADRVGSRRYEYVKKEQSQVPGAAKIVEALAAEKAASGTGGE